MGRSRITEKGRAGRKRGKGHGKDYKPWIEVQDFNSMGTGAILVDPVSGRQMHFLSMGEKYVFYKIMWEEGPAEVKQIKHTLKHSKRGTLKGASCRIKV